MDTHYQWRECNAMSQCNIFFHNISVYGLLDFTISCDLKTKRVISVYLNLFKINQRTPDGQNTVN